MTMLMMIMAVHKTPVQNWIYDIFCLFPLAVLTHASSTTQETRHNIEHRSKRKRTSVIGKLSCFLHIVSGRSFSSSNEYFTVFICAFALSISRSLSPEFYIKSFFILAWSTVCLHETRANRKSAENEIGKTYVIINSFHNLPFIKWLSSL